MARRSFRGLSVSDLTEHWAEHAPMVRTGFIAGTQSAIDLVGEYLSTLADEAVTVAPGPWLGMVGSLPLDDWLDITPNALQGRIAQGMTPSQALLSQVAHIANKAGSEPFRVGREAVAVTSSRDHRFDGWARIANAGACAFCRMLATRGAVYTESTVLRTHRGLKYHSNCECSSKAVLRGEATKTIAPAARPVPAAPPVAVPTVAPVAPAGIYDAVEDVVPTRTVPNPKVIKLGKNQANEMQYVHEVSWDSGTEYQADAKYWRIGDGGLEIDSEAGRLHAIREAKAMRDIANDNLAMAYADERAEYRAQIRIFDAVIAKLTKLEKAKDAT